MSICRVCKIELNNINQWASNKKNWNNICISCDIIQKKIYRATLIGKENHRKSCHIYNKSDKGKLAQHKSNKCFYHNHLEQEKLRVTSFFKTTAGKIIKRKQDAKRRELGYIPLNECREDGWVGHHIDKDYVLFIPEELHKSIRYAQKNQDSMNRINDAVYEWFINKYLNNKIRS